MDPGKEKLRELEGGFMTHNLIEIVNAAWSILMREILKVMTDKTLLVHIRWNRLPDRWIYRLPNSAASLAIF